VTSTAAQKSRIFNIAFPPYKHATLSWLPRQLRAFEPATGLTTCVPQKYPLRPVSCHLARCLPRASCTPTITRSSPRLVSPGSAESRQGWVRLNKGTETAIEQDDREIVRFRFRFSSKTCLDLELYFLLAKVVFAVFIAFTGSAPLGPRFVELTCRWAASVSIYMRFPRLAMPN
jgi:hypothetical protein